jgi:peptidoglycan/LPS O-acetylase OafA/YrhL
MFGIYRFILATMVAFSHLATPLAHSIGIYAVFCFFLLSGYLMTLVLNERYGFSFDGIRRYGLNRFLRIFPPYWVALVASIIIVSLGPAIASSFHPALTMPSNPGEWVPNLIIFNLHYSQVRLVPPAWSIDIEMFFYVTMALILSTNRNISIVWFLSSIALTAYMLVSGQEFIWRYSTEFGASLPFSMGALMYFYRDKIPAFSGLHIIISSGLFLSYAIFSNFIWADPQNLGLYLSLIFGLYVQISLANVPREKTAPWLQALDKRMGDLSYPIFLCHLPIGALVVRLALFGISGKGLALFVVGFSATLVMSLGINHFIESPIQKIRKRFRVPRNTKQPAESD